MGCPELRTAGLDQPFCVIEEETRAREIRCLVHVCQAMVTARHLLPGPAPSTVKYAARVACKDNSGKVLKT